jgi:hypothetical protein
MFAVIGLEGAGPLLLVAFAGALLLPLVAFALLSLVVDWQKSREKNPNSK